MSAETPSQSWYSAMVDAIALIVIAALAMAGKVDGSTAVVIIASLTSARVGVGLGKRIGALAGRPAEASVDSKPSDRPPPTGALVALGVFLISLLHTTKRG